MAYLVSELQRCLSNFVFPGTPNELADHASEHGAGQGLVVALRGLQNESLHGPNALIEALGPENIFRDQA